MDKFDELTGVPAPLPMINIDTDMIIPKQFLKTIKRTGLGANLFHEMRFDAEGRENPDFVLNKPAYRNAKILVAGPNFGCGSSREHAPWALLDFGIKCVIATSFADIFYNNCFKNGILPIALPQSEMDKLFDDAERGANATLTIDLERQEIRGPDGGVIHFEIDPFRKKCLLEGLDDIGMTLIKQDSITDYEAKARTSRPWALIIAAVWRSSRLYSACSRLCGTAFKVSCPSGTSNDLSACLMTFLLFPQIAQTSDAPIKSVLRGKLAVLVVRVVGGQNRLSAHPRCSRHKRALATGAYDEVSHSLENSRCTPPYR